MGVKVTVVGQGYVGLPLAIAAGESGFTVYGLDSAEEKIKKLSSGFSVVEDLSDETVTRNLKSKSYIPTTNPSVIKESDIVLICVPTPLTADHKPDLAALLAATTTVGKNIKSGTLVVVESTIEPGTCRSILLPILLKESGIDSKDLYFAYSPERIDPANKEWGIKNTPKIVAGLTPASLAKAKVFYEKFVDTLIECLSLEVAETAKLLENSFRFVNISFVNELYIFCEKLGISTHEVINAAATKPYGFMPFYPSIGVGGHCIPVDPIYLANKAAAIGARSRFIELADKVNQEMPGYFVGRAEEKLNGLKGKSVLVVGVAYKSNVADVRETPAEALIDGLKKKGAVVSWHDDLVKEWNGEKSVPLSSDFDLAIIVTTHESLNLSSLGDTPIINTKGSIQ